MPGIEAASFAYHRSLAPMMWVFAVLVLIETAVVHLLVALWHPWVAVGLSALSLPVLVWLVLLIRSFRREPVRIADGQLHWPAGRLRAVDVPLAQVGGLRTTFDGELVKARDTFNAALIAYPNVVVDLVAPITHGRRQFRRLAHRFDDPGAFVAALARLGAQA